MSLTFWDRVLERIEEGESQTSVCSGRDGYPSYAEFKRRCAKDPEFFDQVYWALVRGGRIPPPEDPKPRAPCPQDGYASEAFEAALEAIRRGERPYYLRKTAFGAPSHTSLDRYRKRNPDFDRRMREALAQRGKWVARKAKPRKPAPARPEPAGEQLRRRLLQNPLFAAVEAAIPRGLPQHVREDVRSAMIADVLAGDLEVAEVGEAFKSYLKGHYRLHNIWRERSLDAPLGAGGATLLDIL